jgi:hypothetical protein
LGKWRERAPEFDDITIAVIPAIEDFEIVKDFLDSHIAPGAGMRPASRMTYSVRERRGATAREQLR